MVERRVKGDGVELAVLEAGDPDRVPIVLLHGYPDSKEVWLEVMRRLEPHYHVLAYDLRGFGSSSAPSGPAAYDISHLAGDLGAVIDELAPGRPVHLVGHDWGGIMGWEFAAMDRFSGRLASFTTVAGPSLGQVGASLRGLLRRGRALSVLRRIYRSWYVIVLCAPGGPTLGWRAVLGGGRWAKVMHHREGLAYDERTTQVSDGLHGANLYRRNIAMRGPRRPVPAQVPVQLIVPTRDRFISPSYYELAERYAPRVLRRSVSCGHWVPIAEPDRLAQWIGEFVEEVEHE